MTFKIISSCIFNQWKSNGNVIGVSFMDNSGSVQINYKNNQSPSLIYYCEKIIRRSNKTPTRQTLFCNQLYVSSKESNPSNDCFCKTSGHWSSSMEWVLMTYLLLLLKSCLPCLLNPCNRPNTISLFDCHCCSSLPPALVITILWARNYSWPLGSVIKIILAV